MITFFADRDFEGARPLIIQLLVRKSLVGTRNLTASVLGKELVIL